MLDQEEAAELRLRCDRFLVGHGPVRPADLIADIPADVEIDTYGEGGVVAELEEAVAELLGKPAAVFLPSGIMAQQAVLRVLADRCGRSTVLYHPTCHLARHEGGALERVQHLLGRPVGDADRLLTIDDLDAVAEAPAALLLELPQRELGGLLPGWDDLVVQTAWARDRGVAVHCDGARLWEAAAGYDRPPGDLAELFDTVYVSFYKGIGALAGCCVAGDDETVAEVSEWRKRLGGTLFGLWPAAASALTLLRRRLPRMPRYLEHARAVAAALHGVEGVTVLPDPPHTPMFHLLLDAPMETIDANVQRIVETDAVWTIRGAAPTGDPRTQRTELAVGDATLAFEPQEAARLIAGLVAPA